MKFTMVCLAACLAALLLGACKQESSTAALEPVQKTGAVRGVVYATGTTSPISGVQVSCVGVKATTSSDGKYLLEKVPIGQQTLTASKSDYEAYSSSVNVTDNAETDHTIFLTASLLTTNVTGTVRRSDNSQAISQAKVTVGGQATFTDATGYYQLPNISQGPKAMTVEKEGFMTYSTQLFLSSSSLSHHVLLEKGTVWTQSQITQPTVWRADLSPYVTSDGLEIFLFSGGRLTIEPGVTVKFGRDSKLSYINGDEFRAVGTQSQPIILTANSSAPSKGHWEGIHCITGYFENVRIQYAKTGLRGQEKVVAHRLTVQNCSENGIVSPELDGTFLKVSDNVSIGILGVHSKIAYSMIENNGGHGIQSPGAEIQHAIIRNNKGMGVWMPAAQFALPGRILASNISSNSGGGVMGVRDGTEIHFVIDSCTVSNNLSFGIRGSYGIAISNSDVLNNAGMGIKAGHIKNMLRCNLVGNAEWAYYVDWVDESVRNCYLAGNNGVPANQVDITTNRSGGQYDVVQNIVSPPKILDPRSTPNLNIGSKWPGF